MRKMKAEEFDPREKAYSIEVGGEYNGVKQ